MTTAQTLNSFFRVHRRTDLSRNKIEVVTTATVTAHDLLKKFGPAQRITASLN
jgi:hypothetical protein